MNVKDLVAEIISEVASEFNYLVCGYERSGPSNGRITFMDNSNDGLFLFKNVHYYRDQVTLTMPAELDILLNLHDPDSISKIKEYFKDSQAVFNSPDCVKAFPRIFTNEGTILDDCQWATTITDGSSTFTLSDHGSSAINITSGSINSWEVY